MSCANLFLDLIASHQNCAELDDMNRDQDAAAESKKRIAGGKVEAHVNDEIVELSGDANESGTERE